MPGLNHSSQFMFLSLFGVFNSCVLWDLCQTPRLSPEVYLTLASPPKPDTTISPRKARICTCRMTYIWWCIAFYFCPSLSLSHSVFIIIYKSYVYICSIFTQWLLLLVYFAFTVGLKLLSFLRNSSKNHRPLLKNIFQMVSFNLLFSLPVLELNPWPSH